MDELTKFRLAKDDFFGGHPQSPIPNQVTFAGLSYFDENPDLRLTLAVEPTDGEVTIGTSDGDTRTYERAGIVRFRVGDTQTQLTLLTSAAVDGFFLPFRDATSGATTYGAGRYLDLEPAIDGMVEIDFNLAYNPYCAYSDAYSCPLPPPENWLTVGIEAGELNYQT